MKRFAIALIAAVATSHAQSVTITFTSPTTDGCCFTLEGIQHGQSWDTRHRPPIAGTGAKIGLNIFNPR
jgi:hypothetical protein